MARPNNDHQHLRKLRELFSRVGCLPSYSVIASAMGFGAKNAAYKMALRMVRSGHLCKAPGGRLVPGPAFFTVDVSEDEVRAGFGAQAGATGLVQAQALDQLLRANLSSTVFIRVRGESMTGAGIFSGDVAIVETVRQAVHGDIVVAEIDGERSIKELRLDRHGPRLVPRQGGVSPRRAARTTRTFKVIGVVKGIVRTLGGPSGQGVKQKAQGAST